MKINSLNNINPVAQSKNAEKASVPEKPGLNRQMDKMQISGNAQLMQKLLQKTKEIPDIREERVQEIAARIENGQFEMDSNLIAKKILGQ